MKIAIDPGVNGGYAVKIDVLKAYNMPSKPQQWREFSQLIAQADEIFIERLWSQPQRRHLANWTLGGNYAQIQLLAALNGKELTYVTPQMWQKKLPFSLPKDYNEKKRKLAEYAKTFYPKATLKTADALVMIHHLC